MFKKWIISAFVFCFCLETCLLTAAETPDSHAPKKKGGRSVVVAAEAHKRGNLLENAKVEIPFLKMIYETVNMFFGDEDHVMGAGVYNRKGKTAQELIKLTPYSKLNEAQIVETTALLNKYKAQADGLMSNFKEPDSFIARCVLESKVVGGLYTNALNNKAVAQNLDEAEINKIKTNILPMLKNTEYCVFGAEMSKLCLKVVSRIGLKGDLVGITGQEGGITIDSCADPSALLKIVQTHGKIDPKSIPDTKNLFPQLQVIINIMEGAGIDFKKDIIGNKPKESIISVNLEPTGTNGLPDIRLVGLLSNKAAFEALIPKFKDMCMQMGIQIKSVKGCENAAELTGPMLGGFSLFTGMQDDFVVIATGDSNLIKQFKAIKEYKASAQKDHALREYNVYTCFKAKEVQNQLKKFLTSPLMANKGLDNIAQQNIFGGIDQVNFKYREIDNGKVGEAVFSLNVDKDWKPDPNEAGIFNNYSNARNLARKNACKSNMRILFSAVEMYNMDHSEEEAIDEMNAEIIQLLIKEQYLRSAPVCPDGGEYTGTDLYNDGVIRCTKHGTVND